MEEYLYGGHGEGRTFPGDPLIITDSMINEYGRDVSILLAAISPYCSTSSPQSLIIQDNKGDDYIYIPFKLIELRMHPKPIDEIKDIIREAVRIDALELHPDSDIDGGTVYVGI